jgi:hypothetical protein
VSESPPTPKYYVASNRVGARLLLVWPFAGGAFAVLLGLIYAFVSALITEVFDARAAFIIATPVFGGALALAGRAVCYLGRVRRASLRLPILISVGVLGYFASWQFYLNMYDQPPPFDPAPSWMMSPVTTLKLMVQLVGFHGVPLALCWILELAIILGMIVYLQKSDDSPETPFCEQCNKWADQVFHLELADSAATAAADHLRAVQPAALGALKRKPSGAGEWALVRVFRCSCGASRHVCVHHAKRVVGKSARMRYASLSPAGRKDIYFDPGSPDEIKFTPVLENLELDAAGEQALEALK